MTELMRLRQENKKQFDEELQSMSNSRLLSELDDTLQLDILKMSTAEYIKLPNSQMAVYRAILNEIAKRLE